MHGIGIEANTFGLDGMNYRRVSEQLTGWCVVRRLRVVKSPSELVYVRRAAELADASRWSPGRCFRRRSPAHLRAGLRLLDQVMFEGGGDPPSVGPCARFRRASVARSRHHGVS